MKSVAGVLAGCGFLDGAEIQEAVLSLLALERRGMSVAWFAPDRPQHHVVEHLHGRPTAETRNVLMESARIVAAAADRVAAEEHAGSVLPGGFGAAKNLCDFAFAGRTCACCRSWPSVLAARRAAWRWAFASRR